MIKIEDISHVAFSAPDLDLMARFHADFGLLGARGTASASITRAASAPAPYLHITEQGEPGFVALGLRAASVADVESLARAEGVEVKPSDRAARRRLSR